MQHKNSSRPYIVGHSARNTVAQRIATRRGRTVYLYDDRTDGLDADPIAPEAGEGDPCDGCGETYYEPDDAMPGRICGNCGLGEHEEDTRPTEGHEGGKDITGCDI